MLKSMLHQLTFLLLMWHQHMLLQRMLLRRMLHQPTKRQHILQPTPPHRQVVSRTTQRQPLHIPQAPRLHLILEAAPARVTVVIARTILLQWCILAIMLMLARLSRIRTAWDLHRDQMDQTVRRHTLRRFTQRVRLRMNTIRRSRATSTSSIIKTNTLPEPEETPVLHLLLFSVL